MRALPLASIGLGLLLLAKQGNTAPYTAPPPSADTAETVAATLDQTAACRYKKQLVEDMTTALGVGSAKAPRSKRTSSASRTLDVVDKYIDAMDRVDAVLKARGIVCPSMKGKP